MAEESSAAAAYEPGDFPCQVVDGAGSKLAEVNVPLTETEVKLFLLFRDVAQAGGWVARVAGGWVRDKLLGRDSDDIDLALEGVMGEEFALAVNNALEERGEVTHSVGIIESNPEQSKHLRTATACVMGVWIDFVNLRSEAYAADSRIPSVEIGTPLQDAERRDFTLNSMFFNLNSGQIEDQTGRGFTDLRDGIIRTPLPAADTFHDDPLRVLRAVRFAARYGFALTEDIREAIGSEAVVNALDSKVSRERVGKELDGMLKAATTEAVVRAIKLLVNLQLAPHVFRLPDCDMAVADEWVVDGERAVERLQAMAAYQTRLMQEERKDGVDDDAADDAHACGNMLAMPEPVHYLTAMLSPLAGLTYPGKKGKPTAVTSFVMLTSIKQRKKDCALLQKLHAAMATLSEADAGDQLAAAHFARDCQHHWPVPAVLLYGRLHDEELFAHPQLQQVAAFAARRVWQQRPLLSGKDLLRELDLPRGPMVARVVQLQWDAQALQPDIAADELLAVLREKVAAM